MPDARPVLLSAEPGPGSLSRRGRLREAVTHTISHVVSAGHADHPPSAHRSDLKGPQRQLTSTPAPRLAKATPCLANSHPRPPTGQPGPGSGHLVLK